VFSRKHVEELKMGRLRLSDLVRNGVVEWIDAEEEEDTFIALYPYDVPSRCKECKHPLSRNDVTWVNMGSRDEDAELECAHCHKTFAVKSAITKEHTHIEVDPEVILGVASGVVPYPEHNSSPRVTMGAGMGRSAFMRTYRAEERRYPGGQEDHFEIPSPDVRGARADLSYANLTPDDGLISPEVLVQGGEVLIGKTSPPRFLEEETDFLT